MMRSTQVTSGYNDLLTMKHLFYPLVLILIGITGCAAPAHQPPRSATKPMSQASAFMLDSCADRLQEICGIVLEYYAVHRELPHSIEQLQAIAAQDAEPSYLFICPISRKLYVYNADGIPLPGMSPPARVILYDAEPVHDGHRWGVAVSIPQDSKPLIAKVVRLPDNLLPASAADAEH